MSDEDSRTRHVNDEKEQKITTLIFLSNKSSNIMQQNTINLEKELPSKN